MTELSTVWDGVLVGDAAAVAPYSASEWAAREKLLQGQGTVFPNYGVFPGSGGGTYSALQVQAKSPASTNIEVEIGAALVAGYLYQNTAALTFTIGANASGNARIDTAVLRADFVAQTVRAVVKQGTPAASPVHPTLQQDTTIWEIPLADIAVANGFSVINQTDVTNRQRALYSLTAGWQATAHPVNYLPNGNYDAGGATFSSNFVFKAIPFVLTGNMLLQDVLLRHFSTVVNYTLQWGIYFQDTNDGNAAENILRMVANGSASGTTSGTQDISIPATPAPQILPPGSYWLVLREPSFTGAGVSIGTVAFGSFDTSALGYRHQGAEVSSVMPQTLDMVAGAGVWATVHSSLAVRLRGRVFGMSTVL